MIDVSLACPVNEPGQPVLDRRKAWRGLEMKANNALPFVSTTTASRGWDGECKIKEHGDEA